MSFGFGFALPAYPLRGGGGNNPFNQLGPTLDLSFTGVVTDLTDPNGYTLNTNFIIPQYQIAAQYVVWETGVGLVDKTFSQIITFTRASIGTYFDSAGVLQTATSGTPRFDYDPVTLAPRGFLIEEARTNLIFPSEDFANATYTPTNVTGVVNAAVAPNGTTTADELVEDGALGAHGFLGPVVNVANATVYTCSIFAKVKAGTRSLFIYGQNTAAYSGVNAGAKFDVSGAVISTGTTYGTSTSSVQSVGNGWYRCVVTFPATVAANAGQNLRIVLDNGTGTPSAGAASYTGDGTSGFFVWGAQLEAGAFPTSYIPTTTGTVPRNADVASVNTLSPWFNSTEGGLYVEWQSNPTAYARYLVSIEQAGTSATRIDININSVNAVNPRTVVGGAAVASLTGGIYTAGSISEVAFAYKTADYASSFNGATPVTATTAGALPGSLAIMYLGSITGGTQVNGWLRRIVYYPRRLTNDEIRTLTLPTGATITTQDYSLDTNFVGNTVAIGS